MAGYHSRGSERGSQDGRGLGVTVVGRFTASEDLAERLRNGGLRSGAMSSLKPTSLETPQMSKQSKTSESPASERQNPLEKLYEEMKSGSLASGRTVKVKEPSDTTSFVASFPPRARSTRKSRSE